MINITELRIKNCLQLGNGDVVFVRSIFLSGFHVSDKNGIDYNNHQNNIKPIPLSEERLLNMGFNKCEPEYHWGVLKLTDFYETIYWIGGCYFLVKEGDYYSFYHSTDEDTYWFLRNVKYIHQVQNLYFDLTDNELTINL